MWDSVKLSPEKVPTIGTAKPQGIQLEQNNKGSGGGLQCDTQNYSRLVLHRNRIAKKHRCRCRPSPFEVLKHTRGKDKNDLHRCKTKKLVPRILAESELTLSKKLSEQGQSLGRVVYLTNINPPVSNFPIIA